MAHLNKYLGLRIKEIRKSKKMTQTQLAAAIGMEMTNLCKLENGGQLPKEENIEKIAKVLDVPIKELFDFEHAKTKEELQKEIINIVLEASQKDIVFIHKFVTAFREFCV